MVPTKEVEGQSFAWDKAAFLVLTVKVSDFVSLQILIQLRSLKI